MTSPTVPTPGPWTRSHYGAHWTELGALVAPARAGARIVFEQEEWPANERLVPLLQELNASDAAPAAVVSLTLLGLAQQLESLTHRRRPPSERDVEACRRAVARVVSLLEAEAAVPTGPRSGLELQRTVARVGGALARTRRTVYASSVLEWRGPVGREAYTCALWTALRLVDRSQREEEPARSLWLAGELCELVLEWNEAAAWIREGELGAALGEELEAARSDLRDHLGS